MSTLVGQIGDWDGWSVSKLDCEYAQAELEELFVNI